MVSFLIYKFTVIVVIPILLVGIIMFPLVEGNSRSSYGEFCNKTQRCESGVSLICRNELCECIKPDTMTYDTISKSCAVLVGEKCKYEIETSNEVFTRQSYGKSKYQSSSSQTEYYDCVQNGICNDDGVCACVQNHIESSSGTCIKLSGFNEFCEDTTHCHTGLHLTCINGTCQCDPNNSVSIMTLINQFHDSDADSSGSNEIIETQILAPRCAGLAGKPCLNENCAKNSHCNYLLKYCECDEGYIPSQKNGGLCDTIDYNGRCGRRYNTNILKQCNSELICLNSVCKCKYNDQHQIYDNILKKCRSFVWGPCELNKTDDQCISRAECVTNNRTGLPECRCKTPYIENKNRLCEDLEFGSFCDQSYFTPSFNCDQMAPLHCRDGKCDCEDKLEIYYPKERKCKKLVGSICKNNNSCVENAFCKKPYYNTDDPDQYGQCECLESMIQTINRTCELNNVDLSYYAFP